MHHRPCSSKQTGGPGPTIPPNEVMGCSSAGRSTYHHHNDILPPISTTSSTLIPTPLQLFDIFNLPTAYKFQGTGRGVGEIDMAATLGFPFTPAQWKELESQAMIYKYMVASVPVPYELLLPIIQNLPANSHSPLVRQQLRYSTKQDLEPGRCKRTDGKKWRCSRDVAPNQKYCERHMHRGRPRSRKHVELSSNNKTRPQSSVRPNPCKVVGSTILPSATEAPLFLDKQSKVVNNRGADWSMEGGMMQTSRCIFNNNEFGESFTPRRDFIDAWSTDDKRDVSPSGLDLSMAMALGNTMDDGLVKGGSGTAPGGPLAEVLRPSLVAVGDGDSISPPMSSPSGVLQRTMLSLSDGSVCNSPTPTLAAPSPDIVAFQWFT